MDVVTVAIRRRSNNISFVYRAITSIPSSCFSTRLLRMFYHFYLPIEYWNRKYDAIVDKTMETAAANPLTILSVYFKTRDTTRPLKLPMTEKIENSFYTFMTSDHLTNCSKPSTKFFCKTTWLSELCTNGLSWYM